MNITVNIEAPELAKAIENLAAAFSGSKLDPSKLADQQSQPTAENTQAQATPTAPSQQQQPAPPQGVPTAVPTQEQQAPAPEQAQSQQQPQAVPTSAPSYTMDQLAVAATQLVDAGKREDLLQLLNSFGAQALTALPKEQYGAFATKLRELGAKL
jgi:FtsZ-interacting cell division protein ZipA